MSRDCPVRNCSLLSAETGGRLVSNSVGLTIERLHDCSDCVADAHQKIQLFFGSVECTTRKAVLGSVYKQRSMIYVVVVVVAIQG